MRRVAMLLMVLAPLSAFAAEVSRPEWIACVSDADCVVAKGTCDPAAVNARYKLDAEIHFRRMAETVKCSQQFWKPQAADAAARCRLERCQIVPKEKAK